MIVIIRYEVDEDVIDSIRFQYESITGREPTKSEVNKIIRHAVKQEGEGFLQEPTITADDIF